MPPITIGAFKDEAANINLILDGQQRLTSILLAYLGLYPDKEIYKATVEKFANEDINDDDDDDELDDILVWKFDKLTKKGKNRETIKAKITKGNYKEVDFKIDENLLKTRFLGFSYLVPDISSDDKAQQKYYSSVFRSINIHGVKLLPQESRKALYYLDKSLPQFFTPDFCKKITVKSAGDELRLDFVRYLSLLSQYRKNISAGGIARGYKSKTEDYYEKYIHATIDDEDSEMFGKFSSIFSGGKFAARLSLLDLTITSLDIPAQYSSIVDMDMYFFGLIYEIVFNGKEIDDGRKSELNKTLMTKTEELKGDENHKRSPNALKYLRRRMEESIKIYIGFGKAGK